MSSYSMLTENSAYFGLGASNGFLLAGYYGALPTDVVEIYNTAPPPIKKRKICGKPTKSHTTRLSRKVKKYGKATWIFNFKTVGYIQAGTLTCQGLKKNWTTFHFIFMK